MSAEATANAQADMSGRAEATIRSQLTEINALRHALADANDQRDLAEWRARDAVHELARVRAELASRMLDAKVDDMRKEDRTTQP